LRRQRSLWPRGVYSIEGETRQIVEDRRWVMRSWSAVMS